jgi:hypothetical protein
LSSSLLPRRSRAVPLLPWSSPPAGPFTSCWPHYSRGRHLPPTPSPPAGPAAPIVEDVEKLAPRPFYLLAGEEELAGERRMSCDARGTNSSRNTWGSRARVAPCSFHRPDLLAVPRAGVGAPCCHQDGRSRAAGEPWTGGRRR